MRLTFILLTFVIYNYCFGQETTVYKEYYKDGKLKAIQHQGYFMACGMPVGTDTIFYHSGSVSKTIYYDNRKGKTDVGCHGSWTTSITKTFYKNGKLKSKSQTKYSYEGSPCNCGRWIWYNAKGKITKTLKFSNCYDQKPSCKD